MSSKGIAELGEKCGMLVIGWGCGVLRQPEAEGYLGGTQRWNQSQLHYWSC